MKNLILGLFLGILIISIIGVVNAETNDISCNQDDECEVIFNHCNCTNICINEFDESRIDCTRACTTEESDLSINSCKCENNKCVGYQCPKYSPPAPDWCKNGTIVAGEIDENGCQGFPICISSIEGSGTTNKGGTEGSKGGTEGVTCKAGCVCKGETMACPTESGGTIKAEIEVEEEKPTQGPTGEFSIGTIIPISMISEGDKIKIKSGDVEVITSENVSVIESKLTMQTAQGNKEIKIMPETASATAITRLGDLGFTIELKEVGNETKNTKDDKVVYELTGNKQGRFLGIFKITARVRAQIDAETGNIKVIKPWWGFLAGI